MNYDVRGEYRSWTGREIAIRRYIPGWRPYFWLVPTVIRFFGVPTVIRFFGVPTVIRFFGVRTVYLVRRLLIRQKANKLRAYHDDLHSLPAEVNGVEISNNRIDLVRNIRNRRSVDVGHNRHHTIRHVRRYFCRQIKLGRKGILHVFLDTAHRLLKAFAHAEGHVRTNLVGEHFRRRVDAEQAFHAVDDAAEEACHLVGNPANHGRNTAPNTFDNALADVDDTAHERPDAAHDCRNDLRQLRYELRDCLNDTTCELKQ